MNLRPFLNKKVTILNLIWIISSFHLKAAVLVHTVNDTSIETSHFGSNMFQLDIIDLDGIHVDQGMFEADFEIGPAIIGISRTDTAYTQGRVIPTNEIDPRSRPGVPYFIGFFTQGATPFFGPNYARVDVDANGTFETIFEIDFGGTSDVGDDIITRYAYDDTGADLDSISAFNSIPEPGTTAFMILGGLFLSRRHRR